MHEALIVMRREIKSYFCSPIAYVFGMLFLVVVCVVALFAIGHGLPADMSNWFGALPMVFLFFIPPRTMRL